MNLNDRSLPNPYLESSGIWDKFENRFKRVVDDEGKHHAYWCWCTYCDVMKLHAPHELKVIDVDEAWDPLDHRPSNPTIGQNV